MPSANIIKGELGDCWIVSAVAALTIHPTFRFNRFGEWVEVVVDDYLPCTPDGNLIYARSRDPNEFWVSLLEKAYAKLRGCYKALESGSPNGAYVDLSGNVPETINLRSPEIIEEFSDNNGALFTLMKKAMQSSALMSCTMQPSTPTSMGTQNDSGLIFGYSYAITTVVNVRIRMSNLRRRSIQLVQLRNPWHSHADGHAGFTGAWSDWSEEWQLVTKKEMKRLKLSFEDDGAFFMSFERIVVVLVVYSLWLFQRPSLSPPLKREGRLS
ncbi:Calpain-6 [Dinochytrium kinnereticum]|nr:Calpain-6 [Dinochytrium kinnereticum]